MEEDQDTTGKYMHNNFMQRGIKSHTAMCNKPCGCKWIDQETHTGPLKIAGTQYHSVVSTAVPIRMQVY